MPRIRFRWFYTELVQHYFRMGVRHDEVQGIVAKRWLYFIKNWIDKLCEDDKKFIEFVFSCQFKQTEDGLAMFPGSDTLETRQLRLAKLEKRFAVDAGLISQADADNNFQIDKVSTAYTNVKTSITTWASKVKEWFTSGSFGGVNSTSFGTYASNVITGFKGKISSTYTNVKATWKTVTSSRIDTSALKKALPEVAERYTKTSATKRFTFA